MLEIMEKPYCRRMNLNGDLMGYQRLRTMKTEIQVAILKPNKNSKYAEKIIVE